MKMKCQNCQKEFVPKRSDAKFCSVSCKSKHWNRNSENKSLTIADPPPSLQSTLKGVITVNETGEQTLPKTEFITKEIQVETPDYRSLRAKLDLILMKKNMIEKQWKQLDQQAKENANDNGQLNVFIGGLTGVIVGDHTLQNKKNVALGGGAGIIAGLIYNSMTEEDRKKKKIKVFNGLNEKARLLGIDYNEICRQETIIRSELRAVNRYETKTISLPAPKILELPPKIDAIQETIPKEAIKTTVNDSLNDKLNVNNTDNQTINDKIMSSRQLANFDFKKIDFQGKWNELIGKPSITFHLAIHGKPGEGKSTFAIQLANYLAENFGMVIYVSGEEGFSSTMKDKIKMVNAFSANLYIADLKNYDDIIREVPAGKYHFIFIDSLNNMGVDAEKVKQLRERYKESAIITISQATKDGKMRGSYEIIHDADIEIKVENGIATTHKNRFKEKGKEYRVF